MVDFVKLTSAVTNEPVFVNPQHVKVVLHVAGTDGTRVIYDAGPDGGILVKGTPDQVAAALAI
ncbi:hypothetical protein [Caulobacter sp. UNC358MFTsu5.1]|uniref:hypothetical protein n=1 Tax=Caulobacter sp. UNC358MFTsu5.1 TaxID=1449049 RepID=UPI0004A771BB|nr:hypothetical protein [Caulobacter sp. UNC358MFTsu5.1]